MDWPPQSSSRKSIKKCRWKTLHVKGEGITGVEKYTITKMLKKKPRSTPCCVLNHTRKKKREVPMVKTTLKKTEVRTPCCVLNNAWKKEREVPTVKTTLFEKNAGRKTRNMPCCALNQDTLNHWVNYLKCYNLLKQPKNWRILSIFSEWQASVNPLIESAPGWEMTREPGSAFPSISQPDADANRNLCNGLCNCWAGELSVCLLGRL